MNAYVCQTKRTIYFPSEYLPFIASRSGRTHTRPEDIRSSREREQPLVYIARIERNSAATHHPAHLCRKNTQRQTQTHLAHYPKGKKFFRCKHCKLERALHFTEKNQKALKKFLKNGTVYFSP